MNEVVEMLNCIEDPAIALSLNYEIIAANKVYCDLYGDGNPVVGRRCYEVSHHYQLPCDQAGETCPMARCLESNSRQRVLHLHHTPRGEEHVDVTTQPIHDDTGKIRYLVEVMHQVKGANGRHNPAIMVGRAPAFNKMLGLVTRVAPSEAAVMLQGESGTGKELVAQAIHQQSNRAHKPFVVVECSGLTESLFESELFGHERGAFTGAHTKKIGLVEASEGGTLFLDEIGDVPLSLQVKLLRLLETRTYRRVGSTEARQADFRLITATHRNLSVMVEQGEFRSDLFYRISTFPIELPALTERLEDLTLLAESLLARVSPSKQYSLSESALKILSAYSFPGNIRELRNILERATLLSDTETITDAHLPGVAANQNVLSASIANTTLLEERLISLDELQSSYLRQVSERFTGSKKELAEKLGISKRTLFRKLHSLNHKLG